VQELVIALFQRWANKPILVIGGGPSVIRDLLTTKLEPACVISANSHGCRQTKYPVDLIVNVDKIHTERRKPMQDLLRPFGIPIVNKHSWADYRIPDWNSPMNSGITAIALAAMLGGNPIIVTGVDLWVTGREYFHDDNVVARHKGAKVIKRPRSKPMYANAVKRLKNLTSFVGQTNVRPLSGPLTEVFLRYDSREVLPKRVDCPYRVKWMQQKTYYVQARAQFTFEHRDVVQAGQQLALSKAESERYGRLGQTYVMGSSWR
jgi:hypothetical protein